MAYSFFERGKPRGHIAPNRGLILSEASRAGSFAPLI
jgi:hypothetical protein